MAYIGYNPDTYSRTNYYYTATNSQTVISGADNNGLFMTYQPGMIDIFVNGVKLTNLVDYVASDGASISLSGSLTLGDMVNVVSLGYYAPVPGITPFYENQITTAATAAAARAGLDVHSAPEVDGLLDAKLNKDGSNATARTKWRLRTIGEIVYVDTSLTGVEIPPADAGFIELTAGLDGSGQYNEGKLTGETINGSGATLTATAVIDDVASPMHGETIHLINTENRVIYAWSREYSGLVWDDQMQKLTGSFSTWQAAGSASPPPAPTGVLSGSVVRPGFMATGSQGQAVQIDFDSSNSPGARTGNGTLAKGIGLVAFLKYKDVA